MEHAGIGRVQETIVDCDLALQPTACESVDADRPRTRPDGTLSHLAYSLGWRPPPTSSEFVFALTSYFRWGSLVYLGGPWLLEPISDYYASKVDCEGALSTSVHREDLTVHVARLANVVG